MTDQTALSFASKSAPADGVAVVFAEEGRKLAPAAQDLDKKTKGSLSRAAEITGFKGKKEQAVDLVAPQGVKFARIVLVGTDKPGSYSAEDWLNLGGMVRGMLSGREGPAAHIFLETAEGDVTPADIANFALGATLRGYKFKKYKSAPRKKNGGAEADNRTLKKIVIHCADPKAAARAFAPARAIGDGVKLARDLVNEPANVLGPVEFAARAKQLTKLGVQVEVLGPKALEKLGMKALLAVGQGSEKPSHVAVMQWKGAGPKGGAPIAIVGKGVTFDAGGISLKPAAGMEDMKGDMAGAACVAGLMLTLAKRNAAVNAVGLVGLTENMPSGSAQRPGDIVRAMNGLTIEIGNTDAEGRLTLADALAYAVEHIKPDEMIDMATLTGAVVIALGQGVSGMMASDDGLAARVLAAADGAGERMWRLPLHDEYKDGLKSDVADLNNISSQRGAGAIVAGLFMREFTAGVPWAHLDIAGTAFTERELPLGPKGATGVGVRTLLTYLANGSR